MHNIGLLLTVDEVVADSAEMRQALTATLATTSVTATDGALSPKDQEFLHAMAADTGPSKMSDIATRMAKSENYIRVYRQRLIEQGVIDRAGRSFVSFMLPGMREFLEEYAD